uniref:Ovochymase 1 n=1 Tax=Myotis myotis TaxID=51298 RepID=A0A7J7Z6Q6_MYOMY|nr:ovochymase 1 [Myotis myotis]
MTKFTVIVGEGKYGDEILTGHHQQGSWLCLAKEASEFARVSVFLDWIQSKLKDPSFVSLQINNESKSLPRKQLPPLISPADRARLVPGVCVLCAACCYSEMELGEPRGFLSTPRYPLDYKGKLECSWVLRASPSSMATFMDEDLSLPEPHLCEDSVLTIYEESHRERRMSGPKVSKVTRLRQSSKQEHVATCNDVTLTKPAGIIQISRCFHRTTMSSFMWFQKRMCLDIQWCLPDGAV